MDDLHLVRVSLRADRLAAMARQMRIPLRDLDEGYLCHYVTRELWQDVAPAPFVLRPSGRRLDLWGYSSVPASALVSAARNMGRTALAEVADIEGIESRPIPDVPVGRVVGFALRACPVSRLSRETHGHRRGAELDAFLVRCFSAGEAALLDRETVYREWLADRLNAARSGVELRYLRVASAVRERFVRRTQGDVRSTRRIERPDVRFGGTLAVTDPGLFRGLLRHGIGRHRAFGFGALLLVSAGSAHSE